MLKDPRKQRILDSIIFEFDTHLNRYKRLDTDQSKAIRDIITLCKLIVNYVFNEDDKTIPEIDEVLSILEARKDRLKTLSFKALDSDECIPEETRTIIKSKLESIVWCTDIIIGVRNNNKNKDIIKCL